MKDFFKIMFAGPAFFVSAWVLMLFAGVEAHNVGIRPFRLCHVDGGDNRPVAQRGPGDGRGCEGDPKTTLSTNLSGPVGKLTGDGRPSWLAGRAGRDYRTSVWVNLSRSAASPNINPCSPRN